MTCKQLLLAGLVMTGLIACGPRESSFEPDATPVEQAAVSRIEQMPNLPEPFAMKDWKKTALDFDAYVYDFSASGKYLPLIWEDTARRNFDQNTFGIYTAIGDVREGPLKNGGEAHEALGVLGSILGATLVGVDKSDQDGRNYVRMARNYFNRDNGWNIVMNFTGPTGHIGGGYGNDYWYDVFNNVLFYAVGNFYPEEEGYEDIMRTVADQFYRSDSVLGQSYSYSFFDFGKMTPGTSHIPPQEDVAAGYAFILYAAYVKFKDEKYLHAAQNALNVLSAQKESRFYEILMPFAAYVAARMNAEAGTSYDIHPFLDWTFDGTATNRVGWGVISDRWGGYDVHGVVGSTVHNGGYGFLMNTFDLAWPLTAMVRYDQRYARAVGKWLLNAANTSRLFYPYDVPDSLQAIPHAKGVTRNVIAYEGLIKESTFDKYKGITPFIQGDGPNWFPGMPEETMFSVYGSGHVGIFGGIIRPTDDDRILQINCLATDMFQAHEAWPTYLYYNPYSEAREITLDLGASATDIYDSVSRKFLQRRATGGARISLPADAARVVVLVPSGSKYSDRDGILYAGDKAIDFRYTTK